MFGCIYKITCKNPEITDCYVGSTRNLKQRSALHKYQCESQKQRKIYDFIHKNGGWDNWTISQIDLIDGDKATLLRAERYWYDKLKPSLNKNGICLTEKEREHNLKKASYEYYSRNREASIKRTLELRQNNMPHYKEYQKEYREKHREKLNARLRERFECECGGRYMYCNKIRHNETKMHMRYVDSQSSEGESLQSTL